LDEVLEFLNKGVEQVAPLDSSDLIDCFISYGKSHSLELSQKITEYFDANATSYWLDNHITPLGIDKQEFVDNRILSAYNFIFIISAQSVKSEICVRELEFAIENNKSIIIIHHESPQGKWDEVRELLKKYKWHYNDENSQESVLSDINQFVHLQKTDKKTHTELLLKAVNWNKKGQHMDDLLYGQERSRFSAWIESRGESTRLKLTATQNTYLTKSLDQQFFTRMINSLSKRLEFITNAKHFDRTIVWIALLNPLSFIPQITRVLDDLIKGESSTGVSVIMFLIFFLINLSLVLVWIKQRNKGMLASTLLSIVCIISIIMIVLLQ
jgi:hypothetical protein